MPSSKIVPIVFPKVERVYEESECSICFEPLKTLYAALPCGHVYHSDCILKWLTDHRSCPVCRKKMQWTLIKDSSSCC